jgi:hypothetical protein
LDFSDTRQSRDLLVTFSNEIPDLAAYGVSMRVRGKTSLSRDISTVYTRKMKMMRLVMNAASCEPAFPETEGALGSMIANVTMHEIGMAWAWTPEDTTAAGTPPIKPIACGIPQA